MGDSDIAQNVLDLHFQGLVRRHANGVVNVVLKEYGGLRVNHLKRLKALELKNSRLRTVVADQALALVILRETAGKTD